MSLPCAMNAVILDGGVPREACVAFGTRAVKYVTNDYAAAPYVKSASRASGTQVCANVRHPAPGSA